jgi:RND family efflux transporter MFP subunit
MKGKKILITVIIIVALGGGYLLVFSQNDTDDVSGVSEFVPELSQIAVESFKAEYGELIPQITSSGLVRGRREALIISETRGVVTDVFAGIGDLVEEGDPILSVDSRVAELSMKQAEEQLKSAKIDLDSVERAYEKGVAGDSELLRVRSQLAGAEAQYQQAYERFENSVVKASINGFLADFETAVDKGAYINEGTPIARIVDLSRIRVDLFLSADQVRRIEEGAPARITSSGMDLVGMVEAIALVSDQRTGSFRVIVEGNNPLGREIRSGFSAEVVIEETLGRESLLVPSSALFEIGSDEFLYVVKDGRAELTLVEAGTLLGDRREILDGLDEGAEVVVSGLKSISDGSPVASRLALAGEGQ